MNSSKKKPFRLFINIFWVLIGSFILLVSLIFYGAGIGYFGPMPDLQQLENPRTNLASQIISSDGEILGKYYFDENRTPIAFNEIPTNMVEALIATEDERFFEHSGIDVRALLRVFKGLVSGDLKGGGSTITQQLAKNLFLVY